MAPHLKVGDLIQETLAAIRPDFWTFFAVAAPFTLLIDMVLSLYGPPQPRTIADLTPRIAVILVLIPGVIGAIAQLAIAHMVAQPGATPRAALGAALPALPVYIAALFLTAIPTGIGFLALVVPGVYLAARLFPVLPIAAVEAPSSIAAIRRSWDLTAGHGWPIAAFIALAILFLLGASALGAGIGSALALLLTAAGLKVVGGFLAALVNAILATLFSIAGATAAAVIYRKLLAHNASAALDR